MGESVENILQLEFVKEFKRTGDFASLRIDYTVHCPLVPSASEQAYRKELRDLILIDLNTFLSQCNA